MKNDGGDRRGEVVMCDVHGTGGAAAVGGMVDDDERGGGYGMRAVEVLCAISNEYGDECLKLVFETERRQSGEIDTSLRQLNECNSVRVNEVKDPLWNESVIALTNQSSYYKSHQTHTRLAKLRFYIISCKQNFKRLC
ncbi:hypothetical protein Tco_1563398 [Tanacetum coccineum]